MLDEEAAELSNAERHECTEDRRNYRSGHYHCKLLTSAGEANLSVPPLNQAQNRYLTFKVLFAIPRLFSLESRQANGSVGNVGFNRFWTYFVYTTNSFYYNM